MNIVKKTLIGLSVLAVAAAVAVMPIKANASIFNDDNGDNDLGDLIILDALFNRTGSNGLFGGTTAGTGLFNGGSNLGDLLILDELFNDDNGILGNDDEDGDQNGDTEDNDGILNGDDNDLGDLFILDRLFTGNGGGILGGGNTYVVQSGDTLSAIALRFLGNANRFPEIASLNGIANANLIFPGQRLTLPSGTGTGTGILGGGSNLGNLFILDELFNNDNGDDNGILNGDDNDLGDLIILDQLFNRDGVSGTTGGLFGGGSNLGDLLILNELFN